MAFCNLQHSAECARKSRVCHRIALCEPVVRDLIGFRRFDSGFGFACFGCRVRIRIDRSFSLSISERIIYGRLHRGISFCKRRFHIFAYIFPGDRRDLELKPRLTLRAVIYRVDLECLFILRERKLVRVECGFLNELPCRQRVCRHSLCFQILICHDDRCAVYAAILPACSVEVVPVARCVSCL